MTDAAADGTWDARIARARRLAGEHPAAAGLLTFYAALAGYQRTLAGRKTPDPFSPALEAVPGFLAWLEREPTAPAALAETAADLHAIEQGEWRRLLRDRLSGSASAAAPVPEQALFVVDAVLQPFAGGADGPCPFCPSPPVLGVLREEGHGARRGLVCALCLQEREYRRVVCPACGEEAFESLPVYTAGDFAHVRIDACDTCRRYLKTIDLTKDGLAVPVVDDLATVALDLWARERGYTRLCPNILRA